MLNPHGCIPVESKDVGALRKLFHQSTPDEITQTITNSFRTASPENLRVLREIFGPLFDVVSAPHHCVRCHIKYVRSENHGEACVVRCEDDADFTADHPNTSEGYYTQRCCGMIWREGDGSDNICLKTRHTTNPKEVEYYKGDEEDEEDEEEGLNFGGSRIVHTCRGEGCKRSRK